MLQDLPFEIILNIAKNLCFNDKYQLMLTCRALQLPIMENSLYEELLVMGGWIGPDIAKVIKKFKSKKLNGNQVKTLEIDLNKVPDDLYSQLPVIFPNVHTLINEQGVEQKRAYTIVKFLKKWKDSIEFIDMSSGYTHLIQVLGKKNTTFTKLIRLRISPFIRTDFNMWKPDINIVNCLKNAPILKELHLYEARVDIELLEAVHANCPMLDVLNIENCIVLTSDDALPNPIEPAANVTYFTVDGDTVLHDDKCVFLDYIVSKYRNVETFGFFGRRTNRLVNHTVNIMDAKPRAMWLHEDDELPVLQTKQVDLKRTNNSYRLYGAKKLFSKLPSTVKFFSLETSMFKDIAVTMDNSDIQPKVLDFMVIDKNDEITRSKVFTTEQDLLFLKRQTLLEKLKVEMSVETLENAGVVCECLKELDMSIKGKQGDQVQLGLILDAFPSLEILKMETTLPLELIGGKTEGKSFLKLRDVNIKFDSTQADLPQTICTIAPNLKKLSWTIAEALDKNGKRTVNKTPTKKRVPGKSKAQMEKEEKEHEEEQKKQKELEKSFTIDISGSNLDLLHLYTKFESSYQRPVYLDTDIKTKDKDHAYYIHPDHYILSDTWYCTDMKDVKRAKKEDMKKVVILCDSLKELKVNDKISSLKL